jgi:hypothetical protein
VIGQQEGPKNGGRKSSENISPFLEPAGPQGIQSFMATRDLSGHDLPMYLLVSSCMIFLSYLGCARRSFSRIISNAIASIRLFELLMIEEGPR